MTKQEQIIKIELQILTIQCAERNYREESKDLPRLYVELRKLEKELEDEEIQS